METMGGVWKNVPERSLNQSREFSVGVEEVSFLIVEVPEEDQLQ